MDFIRTGHQAAFIKGLLEFLNFSRVGVVEIDVHFVTNGVNLGRHTLQDFKDKDRATFLSVGVLSRAREEVEDANFLLGHALTFNEYR